MLSSHHGNCKFLSILNVLYFSFLCLTLIFLHLLIFQKAALDLGVLTEEEFHELVVPEKIIYPDIIDNTMLDIFL
jgi:hypothetical protein